MTNGLKVYYLPVIDFFSISLPLLFLQMPLLRYIFISEEIDIVHIHQYTSLLCLTPSIMAYLLNLRVVYTDHSLIEFEDTFPMLLDKVFYLYNRYIVIFLLLYMHILVLVMFIEIILF